MHDPGFRGIIIHREMLRAAIIPECQAACFPSYAALEFGTDRVLHEEVDQGLAFLISHVFEVLYVTANVEGFATRLGMRSDKRVYARRLNIAGVFHLHFRHLPRIAFLARCTISRFEVVANADRTEFVGNRLHPIR